MYKSHGLWYTDIMMMNGENIMNMTTFWFLMPEDEEFTGVVIYCGATTVIPCNASVMMIL